MACGPGFFTNRLYVIQSQLTPAATVPTEKGKREFSYRFLVHILPFPIKTPQTTEAGTTRNQKTLFGMSLRQGLPSVATSFTNRLYVIQGQLTFTDQQQVLAVFEFDKS